MTETWFHLCPPRGLPGTNRHAPLPEGCIVEQTQAHSRFYPKGNEGDHGAASSRVKRDKMTSLLFTVQVTARPENMGDGNNERYTAQAFAPNGTPLHYRGEGHTLSAALRQLAHTVDEQEHASAR